MKVKVELHETPTREYRQTKHLSAAHDKIQWNTEQLNEAVPYFKENGCKCDSALGTEQFPLTKDAHTINRQLDSSSKRLWLAMRSPTARSWLLMKKPVFWNIFWINTANFFAFKVCAINPWKRVARNLDFS